MRTALVALCVVVGLSRWLLRATVPDDPDSFGFVLGMSRHFDMEALQPHFPGYPVYVVLGSLLCRLGLSGMRAATAISAIAAAASAWGLAVCARRLAGPAAGLTVAALFLVAWLPLLVGGSALSDGLGTALAIGAFAQLARERPRFALSGLLAGLLLGTRASYWPLVVSLLVLCWRMSGPLALRLRVIGGLLVGTLLWAVPFFAFVGMHAFLQLGLIHLRGHFGWWGGSVATRPDLLLRGRAFLRDLLFDGFVPSFSRLAAIALILTGLVAGARQRGQPLCIPVARTPFLILFLPYALWVFLAQNVLEQPRHVLPLVAGGLLLLGCALARHRLALGAIVLVAGSVTLPLAWQRHRIAPAAAQAADWVARTETLDETAVMADRSWRFFSELSPSLTVRKHPWLSEVIVDLSRFDHFPKAIWLTSEVDLYSGMGEGVGLPRNWEIEPGPHFCRDARIDRAQPCLGLVRLRWNPK